MLLSLLHLLSCTTVFQKTGEFDYIEVYYLPMTLRSESDLKKEEVMDLSDPKVSYICIAEESVVSDIIQITSDGEVSEKNYGLDYRIIIRIYQRSKLFKEVGLDRNHHYEIAGTYYYRNKALINWINQNIPVATFPKGLREPCPQVFEE